VSLARVPAAALAAPSRRIAILVYDGVQSLDVTGPFEVFSGASRLLAFAAPGRAPAYRVELLAAAPGLVRSDSGLGLAADRSWKSVRKAPDTLLVAGGDPRAAMDDRALLDWLARMRPRVRRLGSVCSGSFVLAAAGLLDGRRAATHWRGASLFRSLFPAVDLDDDALFVRDRELITSAGVTAGIDMALALVEEDLGSEVALALARELVVYLKRPGGQSQFSALLAAQASSGGPLGDLAAWMSRNPEADLRVEALAGRVAMSPRNFARVFAKELGTTPAKFVERLRLDAARRRLAETALPLDAVARDAGFSDGEHMRRTFQRHLGVGPGEYRRRFAANPAAVPESMAS
jgi:transcriptional regulator GlxA family with amidase domain